MPGQKHHALTANDFSIWDKAIENGKATINLPPLSIRGTPVSMKKSQVAIGNQTNNTTLPYMFSPPYPYMQPYPIQQYPPYTHTPPPFYALPPTNGPQTPHRLSHHSLHLFSSPIDMNSDDINDVSGFMDWMISKTKDRREVQALLDAKIQFVESMQDLGTIKSMESEDYAKLSIPPGLGKRISRDVKSYMRNK